MYTALIAPPALVGDLPETGYHLVLAHEILASPDLASFYRDRSSQGDFVILDNSAHELLEGLKPNQLIEAARLCGAHEIVLPDRLFFGDDTVDMSEEAYDCLRPDFDGQFMVVPQGRHEFEWDESLRGLIRLSTTVGISKDYEVWDGGLLRRVLRALQLGATTIHLLGWGRDAQQLGLIVDQKIPQIRGVDSGKPITYALAGTRLPSAEAVRRSGVPQYPRRQHDFFSSTTIDWDIALWNIRTFRELAGDSRLLTMRTSSVQLHPER